MVDVLAQAMFLQVAWRDSLPMHLELIAQWEQRVNDRELIRRMFILWRDGWNPWYELS